MLELRHDLVPEVFHSDTFDIRVIRRCCDAQAVDGWAETAPLQNASKIIKMPDLLLKSVEQF